MEDAQYLTILLCTYNRAKLLEPLLIELIKQVKNTSRSDIEILLIDNNSNDATKETVLKHKENASFLTYHFESKQGLAVARNKGLELAKGNIIVFIDDDIILHEIWLAEILTSLTQYQYKAFGGKVIPMWEKDKPAYINLNGFFALNQKIFPAHDNGDTSRLYPITKDEANPIGANMWFHKELFKKYGGFREDLGRVGYGGIPCEDTEFCSRLLRNKEEIFYYPKAIVYHPVSIYRMSKEFIKSWHYRNGISTVRKGGRKYPLLDLIRFLMRLFLHVPFYIVMFVLGISLINKKIYYWSEFRLVRVFGQLREFLRIWLKIPLKDPTFSILFIALILCGCSSQNMANRHNMNFPVEVEVIKITENTLARELKATGTLESPQTTELTSEVAGKIIFLDIPEGQSVKSGHVLAKVNNTTNQAEIEVAKAKLENAKTNFNRIKSLKDEGAVSQQSLDNSSETLHVAEGEFNRVSSVYSMTDITAPFSGSLSIRKISLGQYIDPGDSIVRISQLDPLYLIFNLPEQYVSDAKIGQNIKFKISNSTKEYSGKVSVIDPYIDPSTRSVQIKATIQNSKRELLPGQFANIALQVSNIKNAISIPEEALIQDGNKKQVVVVTEDNKAIFKDVTVSRWDKDLVLISDGLMINDVIITAGHQKVRPGSQVIPKPFNDIHNPMLEKQTQE